MNRMDEVQADCTAVDQSLLIVDDDQSFLVNMAQEMTARGFVVDTAESVADGLRLIGTRAPAHALIDLRLQDGNGLDVIAELQTRRPDARVIMLTGYANISTAVTAVKRGAFDYLAKPLSASDIHSALIAKRHDRAKAPENAVSPDRVRWEHIQHVHRKCGGNVSETARQLTMHRRTLQRILNREPPSW